MKILHTSDWHIGRQFHNVSLLDDQQYVLHQLIAYARDQQVDAIIVAGDIYDRSVPPAAAVAMMDAVVDQICGDLHIPLILISGNHDSAERLGFAAKQMRASGLLIMSDLAKVKEPVRITGRDGLHCHIYGVPYHTPEMVNDVFGTSCKTFDEAFTQVMQEVHAGEQCLSNDAGFDVLAAHCFVVNGAASDSERPLSIGGAEQVNTELMREFDYVALGHLHRPQTCGADHIRYSGSLLKYSFSEVNQNKSVELVTLTRDAESGEKQVHIERLPLEGVRNVRVLEGALDDLLEQGQADAHREDYLLVRLTDTHAILDVMRKLREVYPNVLQLERTSLKASAAKRVSSKVKIQKQYIDMFADFYREVADADLSEAQQEYMQSLVNGLREKL